MGTIAAEKMTKSVLAVAHREEMLISAADINVLC